MKSAQPHLPHGGTADDTTALGAADVPMAVGLSGMGDVLADVMVVVVVVVVAAAAGSAGVSAVSLLGQLGLQNLELTVGSLTGPLCEVTDASSVELSSRLHDARLFPLWQHYVEHRPVEPPSQPLRLSCSAARWPLPGDPTTPACHCRRACTSAASRTSSVRPHRQSARLSDRTSHPGCPRVRLHKSTVCGVLVDLDVQVGAHEPPLAAVPVPAVVGGGDD